MFTRHDRLLAWIAANSVGMALGFLIFLEVLMFLSFGLDLRLHWSEAAVENLEHPERLLRLGLVIGLPLTGAFFCACQAWALRGLIPRLWLWVLCGPAGFVAPMLVIWPLVHIWGDIPGPVEPFTIVGGGMLAVGTLQWLFLRRQRINATRWLALWIAGLPIGMVVVTGVMMATMVVLGEPPWPVQILAVGLCLGGTAAAVSGSALLGPLAATRERSAA